MTNISKKVLSLILIIAFLVPGFSASASSKKEEVDVPPAFDFGQSQQAEIQTESTAQKENSEGTETSSESSTSSEAASKTEESKTEESKTEESSTVSAPPAATQTAATTSNIGNFASSNVIKFSQMQASINKYAATNPAVKGWLYVPNTNMSMPIINPSDNLYYEKRTWDGVHYPNNNYKNYKETATYTDYRVKLGSNWGSSSRNIVIYGHNWSNLRPPYAIGNTSHDMFGQLPSYTSIDFAKKNPYIYFSTGTNEGIWKVFSVALIENDAKVFGYNTPNPSDEAFAKTLGEFKARSLHNFDVDLKTSDRIITLDTCIRHYKDIWDDQRLVVVARLLREGESETAPVSVSANPNVKYPTFKKK